MDRMRIRYIQWMEGMPKQPNASVWGVLEIIKTSERIVSETRCSGVNEIGALGVLKDLLKGAFHSRCGEWIEGKVVVNDVKMSTNK
jgi:hypothetical protein